jgi:hypothetical protein
MRGGSLLLLAAGVVCATPATARANGRYPAATQLVVAPSDPRVLVLRSTFGILVSRDAGATWGWVCENAIGYGFNDAEEDPAIGVTQAESILAGTQEGLAVSLDTGCSWAFAPNAGGWAADVSVFRSQPSSALAITRLVSGMPVDGGETVNPALFRTIDDGKTWAPYGMPLDGAFVPSTVDVAPSDPQRIYLSGLVVHAGIPAGVIVVSRDGGQTWTPTPVPMFDPLADIDTLIGAVDPLKPDRVYVRVVRTTGSRLLVSDNGGMTLTTVMMTDTGLPGFALSPDGSKVYLGGDDGVQVAPSSTLLFAHTSSTPVECLATSGSTLYACSNDTHGFLVGSSLDDGATFTPLLHSCTFGPLACGPTTSAATCMWALQQELNGCPSSDAGADAGAAGAGADSGADASSDAAASADATPGEAIDPTLDAPRDAPGEPADASTPPAPAKSGCGCVAAGAASTGTGAGASLALFALAAASAALGRRRHPANRGQR